MPLPIIAVAGAKILTAVKGMTLAKGTAVASKTGFFKKIGQGISNMFNKGVSNTDTYGNPFGKFGQALGSMFRKDSGSNQSNNSGVYPPNTISQYLPISIIGLLAYLIFKKK